MPHSDLDTVPLRSLVTSLNVLMSQDLEESVRCAVIAKQLARNLQRDWLPAEVRCPETDRYARHLLYEDPQGRFSVGSFVWMPGQETPIHDHHCWGVMGVVCGQLVSENFHTDATANLRQTSSLVLPAGVTAWLSPALGDIHRIANRARHVTAISVHVYGAPFSGICRNQYDDSTGAVTLVWPGVADSEITGG